MANVEPADEQLLQSVLARPFEPGEVPVKPALPGKGPVLNGSAPHEHIGTITPPEPVEEDPWKAEFEAQVNEWRAVSSETRQKAERERIKWEERRKHEEEERRSVGQEPETWDTLGSHITTSIAAASEILTGSTASLVSMPSVPEGAPDPSTLSSPSPRPNSLPPPYRNAEPSKSPAEANLRDPPSTIPSITNPALSRRTRVSLILSSLAINLLLPFLNGVMLGFGEIFAKNILIGWFGWRGRNTANVGLRW